jgi:hypothetical protein
MRKTARNFVIAAVLGGVTCVSVPALAASYHEDGDFGGTWAHIGPSDQYYYGPRHRYRYVERYAAPVYGPAYAYEPYYDPYDYGPSIAIGGPGIGVGIDLD